MMSGYQPYSPWAAPRPDPGQPQPPPGVWPLAQSDLPPYPDPRPVLAGLGGVVPRPASQRIGLLFVAGILLIALGVVDGIIVTGLWAFRDIWHGLTGRGAAPIALVYKSVIANDLVLAPLIGGLGIAFSNDDTRGGLVLGFGVFAIVTRGIAPFLYFDPARAVLWSFTLLVPILYTVGAVQLRKRAHMSVRPGVDQLR